MSESIIPGGSNGKLTVAIVLFAILAGGPLVRWWTRPPVVESGNLKHLQVLMTAVSSRNQEQLERIEGKISGQLEAGEMSMKEHQAFQKIITQAKSGEWEQAYQESFRLAEGQLSRRRTPSSADQGHSHDHSSHDHHHGHDQDKK
ncbi:MAG TPA: hypothetical protein VNQ76_14680 [Planctomicrobium sp.]|nr:hypothetical protein [Planctomicrobium sp.]